MGRVNPITEQHFDIPARVGMISLGCSKNQVDAERMLAQLRLAGFQLSPALEDCDAVIVNTCGFIEDAKRESIEAILDATGRKGSGRLRVVVATGCLAERYREEMAAEIPELDVVLGIGRNSEIVRVLRRALAGETVREFGEKSALSLEGERVLANPEYYAYLKVAEGCDNRCSYCAIPSIRGGFRSRRIEDVLAEARDLAARGVRELNLVAQDTTRYGEDLYGELALPRLLREICRIEALRWVRVLYCYPQRVSGELLETMRGEEKIVPYIDLPLQHCSESVLRRMYRQGSRGALLALLARIRRELPGVALRTTFIAGFPGESEAEFAELCDFVREARFDRLGCFAYSREEDTPAHDMDGQLDEETKRRRAEIVMEIQQPIALELAGRMTGSAVEVLAEGWDEEAGMWFGRSPADAPDIDTRVYFTAAREAAPRPGEFLPVRITGPMGYDLAGELIE